jgi:hypothetical protein
MPSIGPLSRFAALAHPDDALFDLAGLGNAGSNEDVEILHQVVNDTGNNGGRRRIGRERAVEPCTSPAANFLFRPEIRVHLCVPKTLSELMPGWNRLSWRNDGAALFRSGRPGLAIQVKVAASG